MKHFTLFSATEFKRGIEKLQCHHFPICKSCGFSKITEAVAKKLGLAGLKRWLLAQFKKSPLFMFTSYYIFFKDVFLSGI